MATIQVYKYGSATLLGSGDGVIDAKNQTAVINAWTKKAGLLIGQDYKLKAGGKTYSDAVCIALNIAAPVASFNDVS